MLLSTTLESPFMFFPKKIFKLNKTHFSKFIWMYQKNLVNINLPIVSSSCTKSVITLVIAELLH